MNEVEFTVPGPPQGKARARTYRKNGRSITYTPLKTIKYENKIKASCKTVSKVKFEENIPLEIEILALFAVPKSTNKKDKVDMLSGKVLPTKKPDLDNISKVVFDALNGVAYRDDKQVCDVKFKKFYGEMPRLEIKIKRSFLDEEN